MVASSSAVLPLPGPPRMTTFPGGAWPPAHRGAVGKANGARAGEGADDRSRGRPASPGRRFEAAGRLVRGGQAWPVHDAGILASGYDAG